MKIIADIGFNRDIDVKEFGAGDRIVRISRFEEDGGHKVSLAFELGQADDDTLSLTLGLAELLLAIIETEEDIDVRENN